MMRGRSFLHSKFKELANQLTPFLYPLIERDIRNLNCGSQEL